MYIYSTATADQKFNLFHELKKGDVPRVAGHVVIRGGANVANKNLVTASGVATQITDKEYELLKKVSAYADMVESGFMHADAKKVEPEDAAKKHLKEKDGSAPLTAQDAKKANVNVSEEEVVV